MNSSINFHMYEHMKIIHTLGVKNIVFLKKHNKRQPIDNSVLRLIRITKILKKNEPIFKTYIINCICITKYVVLSN